MNAASTIVLTSGTQIKQFVKVQSQHSLPHLEVKQGNSECFYQQDYLHQ
jgi:hypothetical protein